MYIFRYKTKILNIHNIYIQIQNTTQHMKRNPPPPPPNKKVVPPPPSSQQVKSNVITPSTNQIVKPNLNPKQEIKQVERPKEESIKKQQMVQKQTVTTKIPEKKIPQKRIPPGVPPRMNTKPPTTTSTINNNPPPLDETNVKVGNQQEVVERVNLQNISSQIKKQSEVKKELPVVEKSPVALVQPSSKIPEVIKKVPPPPPNKGKVPPPPIQKIEKPSVQTNLKETPVNSTQIANKSIVQQQEQEVQKEPLIKQESKIPSSQELPKKIPEKKIPPPPTISTNRNVTQNIEKQPQIVGSTPVTIQEQQPSSEKNIETKGIEPPKKLPEKKVPPPPRTQKVTPPIKSEIIPRTTAQQKPEPKIIPPSQQPLQPSIKKQQTRSVQPTTTKLSQNIIPSPPPSVVIPKQKNIQIPSQIETSPLEQISKPQQKKIPEKRKNPSLPNIPIPQRKIEPTKKKQIQFPPKQQSPPVSSNPITNNSIKQTQPSKPLPTSLPIINSTSNDELQRSYAEFLKAKKLFQQSSSEQGQEQEESPSQIQSPRQVQVQKQVKQLSPINNILSTQQQPQPQQKILEPHNHQTQFNINQIQFENQNENKFNPQNFHQASQQLYQQYPPLIYTTQNTPYNQQLDFQFQQNFDQPDREQQKFDEIKKYPRQKQNQNVYEQGQEQKKEQNYQYEQQNQEQKNQEPPKIYQQPSYNFTPSFFAPQVIESEIRVNNFYRIQEDQQQNQEKENVILNNNQKQQQHIEQQIISFSDLIQKVKVLTQQHRRIKQQSQQSLRELVERESQYLNRILHLKQEITDKDELISQAIRQH